MASTQNQRFLDIFWNLASVDLQTQNTAAATLVRSIDFCQKRYESNDAKNKKSQTSSKTSSSGGGSGRPSKSEVTLGEGAGTDPTLPSTTVPSGGSAGSDVQPQNFCPELSYTLQRLIDGLASSREGARIGYSIALTELLVSFSIIPLPYVVDKIIATHPVDSVGSREEIRDSLFGVVFGIMAVVRSEKIRQILENNVLGAEGDQIGEFAQNVVCKIIEIILKASEKKSFLPEICSEILVGIFKQIPRGIFKNYVLPLFKPKLESDPKDFTPETVLIIMNLRSIFSLKISKYSRHLTKRNLLHPRNIHQIKNALFLASYTSPKLHSVWNYVIEETANVSTSQVQAFCSVIDEIFSSTSNNTKHMGYLVVQKLVSVLTPAKIQYLYTRNFLRCLIGSLSHDMDVLNKTAKLTLSALINIVRTDSTAAMAAITAFEGPYGTTSFDKKTKTKTVSALLTLISPESTQTYTNDLFEKFYSVAKPVVEKEGEDNEEDYLDTLASARRRWAVDQLVNLAKGKIVPNREETVLVILKFLFFHAFYQYIDNGSKNNSSELALFENQCHPPMSDSVRTFISQRFFSVLSYLNTHNVQDMDQDKNKDQKNNSLPKVHPGTMSDGESWVFHIFAFQEKLLECRDIKRILPPKLDRNDEEDSDVEKIPQELLQKKLSERIFALRKKQKRLSKKKSEDPSFHTMMQQYKTFELLLLNVGFTFNSNPTEVQDSLQELCDIYDQLFGGSGKDPKTIEVLTDLFVSWLVKPSSPIMRDTIESAFRSFCPSLTPQALDILLDVIKKDLNNEKEEEEEDEDEEDDVELEDEIAVIQSSKSTGSTSKSLKSSRSKSTKSIINDDDSGEADIAGESSDDEGSISGKNGAASEKSKADMSDETMSSMDDEQMFQLDHILEDMFKLKKDAKLAKQDKINNRKEYIQFKQRVISLVDIFIQQQYQHHQQQNPLVFQILLPLVDAIVNVSSGNIDTVNLVQRIESVFNKLCKPQNKSCPRAQPEDVPLLHDIMNKLFEKAKTTKLPAIVRMCGTGITFLMRILIHPTQNNQEKEIEDFGSLDLSVFKEALIPCLNAFLCSRKTVLTSAFFQVVLFRYPKVGWLLVPTIAGLVEPARNIYKTTAIDWLLTFLRMKKEMGPGGSRFIPVTTSFYEAFVSASKNKKLQTAELRKAFNLLLLAVQESIRHQGLPKTQAIFPVLSIEAHMSTIPVAITAKPSIDILIHNIVSLLTTGALQGKKRKRLAQEIDKTQNQEPTATKKQKISKVTQEAKPESKTTQKTEKKITKNMEKDKAKVKAKKRS